jgi:hypothetical protein
VIDRTGLAGRAAARGAPPGTPTVTPGGRPSSTVPQPPQPGQRPTHFAAACPHAVHSNGRRALEEEPTFVVTRRRLGLPPDSLGALRAGEHSVRLSPQFVLTRPEATYEFGTRFVVCSDNGSVTEPDRAKVKVTG